MDVATGDFVTFVDADDWLEVDAYEKLHPHFPCDVDMVCFGSYVDGNLSPEERDELEKFLEIPYEGELVPVNLVGCEINGCIWNKIYRRSIIEQSQLRFAENLAYTEDECFTYCYLGLA